ncbi:MAG: molybdate ABC transporter substrate-binding protein [Solirubrobacteraceae bacterium]|nr:molybdate ABC transporter substrate-binding protein [Solirubrobacteraceae bacterium]
MRRCLVAAFAVALLAPGSASAMSVYAASSLRDVFPRIDGRPTFNFAGSNQLQLQVERGAPADVFASASPAEAQALYRQRLCTRPITFATNRLVIIVPEANPAKVRSVTDLRHGGFRVAIGTRGVPIGAYTRKVLRRLGLLDDLKRNRVSQEPDVGSITAKVALGSADLGFVYFTDARIARDRTDPIALPRRGQPRVDYQTCVVRRKGGQGEPAKAFIRRVLSDRGRRLLRAAGFGVPRR